MIYRTPWRVVELSETTETGNRWSNGRANVIDASGTVLLENIEAMLASQIVEAVNAAPPRTEQPPNIAWRWLDRYLKPGSS